MDIKRVCRPLNKKNTTETQCCVGEFELLELGVLLLIFCDQTFKVWLWLCSIGGIFALP